MKHKRLIAGAGLLGLVILIAGWTLYGRNGHFNTEILLLGNIDVRQVDLASKAPGRLAADRLTPGPAMFRRVSDGPHRRNGHARQASRGQAALSRVSGT